MQPADDSEGDVFSSYTALRRLEPMRLPRFRASSKQMQNHSIILLMVNEKFLTFG
jgi:hypothetical protein